MKETQPIQEEQDEIIVGSMYMMYDPQTQSQEWFIRNEDGTTTPYIPKEEEKVVSPK